MFGVALQSVSPLTQLIRGVEDRYKSVPESVWNAASQQFQRAVTEAEGRFRGQARLLGMTRNSAGATLARSIGWVGHPASKLAQAAAALPVGGAAKFLDELRSHLTLTVDSRAPNPANRPSGDTVTVQRRAIPDVTEGTVLPQVPKAQARPTPRARRVKTVAAVEGSEPSGAFQATYNYGGVTKLVDAVLATPHLVKELRQAARVSLQPETVTLVATEEFKAVVKRLVGASKRLNNDKSCAAIAGALLKNLLSPEDPRLKFNTKRLAELATAFLRARSLLRPSEALDFVAKSCRPVPVTHNGTTYIWNLTAIAQGLKNPTEAPGVTQFLRRMRDVYDGSAGSNESLKEGVRADLIDRGYLTRRS